MSVIEHFHRLGRDFPRHYWFFVGGQCLASAADNFMAVAIAAFTYGLTGSAWAYAVQMLVGFLPSILLSGIAGRAVDRMDRRRLLIMSDICSGALILLYPLCRFPGEIYSLNFIRSVTVAFSIPARIALMPQLVGKESVLRANGVRTTATGAINLAAPVMAGALIGRAGATVGFLMASVSVIGSTLCWAALPRLTGASAWRKSDGVREGQPTKQHQIRQVVRQMMADPLLVSTVVLFSIYSIGAFGTNAIYYPFVSSVLRAGPWFFGAAVSLYYGANLVGGLLVARFGLSRLPYVGLVLTATALWAGLSVFRSVVPLLFLSFAGGLLYCLITTFYETTVQVRAPEATAGQTASIARAVVSVAQISGIAVCGWLAELLGPVMAYRWAFGGGVVLTLAAGLVTKRNANRARGMEATSTD